MARMREIQMRVQRKAHTMLTDEAQHFGDCFAYGLARARQAPLLFVGEDFAKTDLDCA